MGRLLARTTALYVWMRCVFFAMTDEEIRKDVKARETTDTRKNKRMDGGSYGDERHDETEEPVVEGITMGQRTERWFQRIETNTNENTERSMENKNILMRMDYRTIWIARLILGLTVTIIGGLATKLVIG